MMPVFGQFSSLAIFIEIWDFSSERFDIIAKRLTKVSRFKKKNREEISSHSFFWGRYWGQKGGFFGGGVGCCVGESFPQFFGGDLVNSLKFQDLTIRNSSRRSNKIGCFMIFPF